MFRWVPYSLVRITLFYIAGILLAIYQGDILSRSQASILVLSLSISFLVLWSILRKVSFRKFNILLSATGFLCILSFGFLNLKLFNQSLDDDHLIHASNIEAYLANVVEPAYSTEKTNRYLVELQSAKIDSTWKIVKGKAYLYINKRHDEVYDYGDQLIINGSPRLLSPPQNPGEFDYKRFLTFKNIYHQQYSDGTNIRLVGVHKRSNFMSEVLLIRQWAVSVITKFVKNEREQNIALALILGVKDGLTDEIKNAYSASGAMHVLAVSGLHVGIVYGIVLLLLGRMQSSKSGRWILAVTALVILWGYAAITGFSPSVLRAVTMFSFIAVAKASGRTTNIYNTLSASAFVLLLFDPYLIMSVGFQLSYLAVLGIVYVQPKIYNLIISKNYVLDKVWAITSVSIAAQLATFSLGILYFHQFPTFFLLSNLVVIPGAFLILLGGLLLIAVSFSTVLGSAVGYLLNGLIYLINEGVFLIEELPFSLISNIYITTLQTWMIIGLLLCLFLFFQKKRIYYLQLTLVLTCLFGVTKAKHIYANSKLQKMTIYKINNHTAIDLISAGKSKLLTDSVLWNNADKKRFHITPNQLRSGIYSSQLANYERVEDKSDLVSFDWQGEQLTILDVPIYRYSFDEKIISPYLLISKGFKGSLSEINKTFEYDLLIIDGSLSSYRANKLEQEAKELEINYYSVFHNGALEITI